MFESEEEFLGTMFLSGAARSLTRDESGEMIIEWDMELLRELFPEVFDSMLEITMDEISEDLNHLVELGYLEREPVISPDGELDELYSVTDEGRELVKDILPVDPDDLV